DWLANLSNGISWSFTGDVMRFAWSLKMRGANKWKPMRPTSCPLEVRTTFTEKYGWNSTVGRSRSNMQLFRISDCGLRTSHFELTTEASSHSAKVAKASGQEDAFRRPIGFSQNQRRRKSNAQLFAGPRTLVPTISRKSNSPLYGSAPTKGRDHDAPSELPLKTGGFSLACFRPGYLGQAVAPVWKMYRSTWE